MIIIAIGSRHFTSLFCYSVIDRYYIHMSDSLDQIGLSVSDNQDEQKS